MRNTLKEEASRLTIPLTDLQLEQFETFGNLLIEKNKVMNLTAITEPTAVAKLHFADCLALLTIEDLKNKSVIDVGCGAGFPGVPLKIGEPTIDLTLLDSLQKRVNWLDETLRSMDISAKCVSSRAEEYAAREQYDYATSRAVARLNILCELCLPFVKIGGAFLAMKGALAEEELNEAKHAIAVLGGKVERIASYEVDGAQHRVIVIRKIKATPSAYPRRYAKIKQQPL